MFSEVYIVIPLRNIFFQVYKILNLPEIFAFSKRMHGEKIGKILSR